MPTASSFLERLGPEQTASLHPRQPTQADTVVAGLIGLVGLQLPDSRMLLVPGALGARPPTTRVSGGDGGRSTSAGGVAKRMPRSLSQLEMRGRGRWPTAQRCVVAIRLRRGL